ncbi:hypothetical protein H6F89_28940 [Cyanobacteria bacterium FACHB-63]|nr:hypothetical protein [Cyanobacteria bacterium FACHB-63]
MRYSIDMPRGKQPKDDPETGGGDEPARDTGSPEGQLQNHHNRIRRYWAGDRSGDSSRAKFKRFQRSLFAVTEQHDPLQFSSNQKERSRSRSLERKAIGSTTNRGIAPMLIETPIKRSLSVEPIAPTCSQCREFDNGLCKLRARAEWDNCYVKPDRKPCRFADLLPF